MSLLDRIPTLSDDEVVNLLANAQRLAETGDDKGEANGKGEAGGDNGKAKGKGEASGNYETASRADHAGAYV